MFFVKIALLPLKKQIAFSHHESVVFAEKKPPEPTSETLRGVSDRGAGRPRQTKPIEQKQITQRTSSNGNPSSSDAGGGKSTVVPSLVSQDTSSSSSTVSDS